MMVQVNFDKMGGGIGEVDVSQFETVVWKTTAGGGLNIPTTKKALGVILAYSSYLNSASAKDGKMYTNGTYDSTRPFTFSDSSITCPTQWGNGDFSMNCCIIYGE